MDWDKRQLARLEVAVKVRVALASHDEFSAHFTENLSGEGVFVRAVRPRPVGSNLDLEYVLADGTMALKARGVVRWTRVDGEDAVGPPGMGVHLAAVDGPGRRFLAALLRSRGAAPAGWMDDREAAGPPELDAALQPQAVVVRLPALARPARPATDTDSVTEEAADAGSETAAADTVTRTDTDPAADTAADTVTPTDTHAAADTLSWTDLDADTAAHSVTRTAPDPAVDRVASQPHIPAAASDLAGLTLPDHVARVPAAARPTPRPSPAPSTAATADLPVAPAPDHGASAQTRPQAPLGVVVDLAGADLLAGLVIASPTGPAVDAPTSLTPRLGRSDEALKVKNAGTWVPCLVPLAGLGWPSPTATLWARRFGLDLGASDDGGVAIIVGGRPVPVQAALASCLAELLEPYAGSEPLPAHTWVVLPAGAGAAGEVVRHVLDEVGLAAPTFVSDAVVLASAAGEYEAGGAPRLVVHTTLLETRATIVSGEADVLAVRSALDTGLWRADDILADQIALRLSLTRELERGDEQAFRRDLVAAVAAAREGQDPKVWRLDVGNAVHSLTEDELCELAHGASIRVLLACEEALSAAGVHQDEVGAVVLAADEPPWPGLSAALSQGLGRAVTLAGTHAWYRLERAALQAGRAAPRR